MIDIINENKLNKQNEIKQMKIKQEEKKQRKSYILTLCGYLIAIYVFVQIVILLVR